MEKTYEKPAETAKRIRQALKAAFPKDYKGFSIRTHRYAGGASIHIDWTDGPQTEAVRKVACQFEGATFDGMIDLKSYKTFEVIENGERKTIQSGADYVFCQRRVSDGLAAQLDAKIAARFNAEDPEMVRYIDQNRFRLRNEAEQDWAGV